MNGTDNSDRVEIEQIEAQLLRSLLCKEAAPALIDSSKLNIAAMVLYQKRKRAVERCLSHLVLQIGHGEFEFQFANYVRANPSCNPSGTAADAKRFLFYLRIGEFKCFLKTLSAYVRAAQNAGARLKKKPPGCQPKSQSALAAIWKQSKLRLRNR